MQFLKYLVALSLSILLLSACSEQTSQYQALSEKPPISVIPHTNSAAESIIQSTISLPLNDLRQRLEADIPESLYDEPGEVKQKCIRIFGKRLCESYQVGGWADRTGPIQLIALNNGYLRIAIPLEYKLKVSGNGKFVKELLRNIDFRTASLTVMADLKPAVDTNWQLQVDAYPSIQWQEKPRVKILGVELDIQSKVERPILKALNKALQKQQFKLSQDNRLRSKAESFWTSLHQPREIKGSFPLWLQAKPVGLSLSEIVIDQEAIRLGLAVRTQLKSHNRQAGFDTTISPLPLLYQHPIQSNKLRISLPLSIAYRDLASNLQQRLSNKPLILKQGKTSVDVKSIQIYPNNDRLVLGAKVRLSGLGNLLTSGGEIFVSGKPVVDNQNKVLRLNDVVFSRKLDNLFWSAATRLLQEKLLNSLQESLVYDFSQPYSELYESVNAQLQGEHGTKLWLDGKIDSIEISEIQPDLESIRVILDAEGTMNALLRR